MASSIRAMQRGVQTGVFIMALLFCLTGHAGGWTLTDQHGEHFTQFNTHGKWVMVNFWAPWCPACLQEMPDLVSLQQRRQSLQVIGVAVMYRTRQKVMEIEREAQLNYPVVMGNEDIASDFGSMRGLPTSYLYNPDGKLVAKYNGPVAIPDVERRLEAEHATDAKPEKK